jgi:bifunctional non-homologous end joining protein LigD
MQSRWRQGSGSITEAGDEMAKADEVRISGMRISSPDDVMYAEQGITKRELAEYYVAVAGSILPFLRGRPLTLVRCPDGEGGACFYQRHAAGHVSPELRQVEVEKPDGGVSMHLAAESLKAVLSMVQMRVLELHTWNARRDRLDRPDRMVLDLDPGPGVPWSGVVGAAFSFRDRLEELGLRSFVKTTGGKGVHVVVPLARRHNWEQVREFSRALATEAARRAPQHYLEHASKADRKGRIFVDYLRNAWGASIVTPFSTRSRPGAPVSTPLTWDELRSGAEPMDFTVRTVPERLAALREDPWQGYAEAARQTITRAALRKVQPPA